MRASDQNKYVSRLLVLVVYLADKNRSFAVCTPCCWGVGSMVGGDCGEESQDIIIGCSSCSGPLAWLFISYWAANILGKWCSLIGCQAELNFPFATQRFIEEWRWLDFVQPYAPVLKDNLEW